MDRTEQLLPPKVLALRTEHYCLSLDFVEQVSLLKKERRKKTSTHDSQAFWLLATETNCGDLSRKQFLLKYQ